jgi:hypothetical protein
MERYSRASRVLIISMRNNHEQDSLPEKKVRISLLKINQKVTYYHLIKPLPNPSPYQGEGRRGEVNQIL